MIDAARDALVVPRLEPIVVTLVANEDDVDVSALLTVVMFAAREELFVVTVDDSVSTLVANEELVVVNAS